MIDGDWQQIVQSLDSFWRWAFADSTLFVKNKTAFLCVNSPELFEDFYLAQKGLNLVRDSQEDVTSIAYVQRYFAQLLQSKFLTLDKVINL